MKLYSIISFIASLLPHSKYVPNIIKVAILDDDEAYQSYLKSLLKVIGHPVSFTCKENRDVLEQLISQNLPDVILVNVDASEPATFETILWLNQHFQSVKILATGLNLDENSIIMSIMKGAKGYIYKHENLDVLYQAIKDITIKGFYDSFKPPDDLVRYDLIP